MVGRAFIISVNVSPCSVITHRVTNVFASRSSLNLWPLNERWKRETVKRSATNPLDIITTSVGF